MILKTMLGLARDKLTHHDYMFNVVTSFVCMRVFIHFGMLLIPSSGSQSWLPARVVAVVCVCVCMWFAKDAKRR